MAKEKRIWITKYGEELVIKNMKTSHIINALRMCERAGMKCEEVEWLREEKEKRRVPVGKEPINDRFEILDIRKD